MSDTAGDLLSAEPDEDDLRSIVARVRLGIWFVVATVVIFAIADVFIAPTVYGRMLVLKAAVLVSCGWLWWFARRVQSHRALYAGVFFCDIVAVLVVSISSTIVGADWHPAALAGTIAIATAALIPWGVGTQTMLAAAIAVCALVPSMVVWGGARTLLLFASLSPVACSVLMAWQNERHQQRSRSALQSFRENFARLRQLTEHIHGVFWLNEVDGTLLYVSPRYEAIWDQSRNRLAVRPAAWLDSVHPDDRAAAQAWFNAGASAQFASCEYRLLRSDGSIRWIRDRIFPITASTGGVWRIARLSLDVTAESEPARARQMHELARSIQGAVEEERKRIARELHDELGQALTGIKLLLTSADQAQPSEPRQRDTTIQVCVHEIERAMESVHEMIHQLRPPALDDLGLVAALRSQAHSFASHTGIPCHIDVPDGELALSEEEVTTVFRIAQESLTNVARHAHATAVELRFAVSSDRLQLSVEDDGTGIATGREDFGLRGMRERAALLNGSLAVERRREGGTLVRLELPRAGAAAYDAFALTDARRSRAS